MTTDQSVDFYRASSFIYPVCLSARRTLHGIRVVSFYDESVVLIETEKVKVKVAISS